MVDAAFHRLDVPGLSLAVVDAAGVLSSASAGFADLATRRAMTPSDAIPWFSMSKIVSATAAMRLHAEGRLELDAPASTYLPAYPRRRAFRAPTVRELLMHTAGLANPLPLRWARAEHAPLEEEWLPSVVARYGEPRRAPGGRAAYSNIGYLLAGQVVEHVTGLAFADAVQQLVLDPLGLTATGYRFGSGPRAVGYVRAPAAAMPLLRRALPDGVLGGRVGGDVALRPFLVNGAAYGGVVGTVEEAALFAAAHARDGELHGARVLPREQVLAMRRIGCKGRTLDHGIGWFRPRGGDRGYVEHYGSGAGFWNVMRIYPGSGIAVVASANRSRRWDFDAVLSSAAEVAAASAPSAGAAAGSAAAAAAAGQPSPR